jgi:hypothetical protein
MKKEELKVGQKVKAKFRKYGVHSIVGEVTEVCTDEHALQGTWVSIKVTGGNMNDPHVSWLVANRVGVLVPLKDVGEVLQ